MSAIRVAFAGVGFMGQVAHLRNYAHREDCQVVAIAEPRAELAAKVAAAFGVPKIYADHRELIDDPNIDAVIASQPHLRNGHRYTAFARRKICLYREANGGFARRSRSHPGSSRGGWRASHGRGDEAA